jgi:hypothetical protein
MRRKSFTEELREAIRRSGRTYYDIAKEMRVATASVWWFGEGKAGMTTALLDRQAEVLDLHATIGTKRKAGHRGNQPQARRKPLRPLR